MRAVHNIYTEQGAGVAHAVARHEFIISLVNVGELLAQARGDERPYGWQLRVRRLAQDERRDAAAARPAVVELGVARMFW